MKRTILLVASIFISGCVGIIVPYTGEENIPNDNIGLTKVELENVKGKPSSIEDEKWVYESNESYERLHAGIFLAFIIPLPLVFPIGHESTVYSFKNDLVSEATRFKTKDFGLICGFVLEDAHNLGWGCLP